MGEKPVISKLSDEMRKRIKKIVNFHYGFNPKDEDINYINKMLRNDYSALHDQRIIRNLVTVEIDKILLKYRNKIENIALERLLLDKLIFRYLTYASMCYRAGIPIASIVLCRTALEVGLRERIAEELAKKECNETEELPKIILKKIGTLKDRSLGTNKKNKGLIDLAGENNIISNEVIEEIFKKLKYNQDASRRILDKFIHGDFIWMVNFVEEKDKNSRVIGAKNILEEKKIIANSKIDEIAVEVLKGTTKIAEILYLRYRRK